jgi:uncharacterized protein
MKKISMSTTRKVLYRTIKLLLILYVLSCIVLYFFQEKLIFFPDQLDKDYRFHFAQPFEELTIQTADGSHLNGLLFTADSSKGLIFYLHGNAGSLKDWGEVASRYTDLHYSVFLLDYPGYGKSEGRIQSRDHLFQAIQSAYDSVKRRFQEARIVVLGYSLGTGPAANLAANNHPKLLILQAPYYSMTDMMRHRFPIIPTFLLKYKIQTHEYLRHCKSPLVVFHGDQDEVIYYGSSLKLQAEMKKGDTLITLRGQGHNGMTDNPDYVTAIRSLLSD